jgi:transglutaminase-like putative cysteine protease
MCGLVMVALVPLSSAYGDGVFWAAAGGGVLLGAGAGLAGWRWRWHAITVAAAALGAYFVFGGVLVFRDASLLGFVPSVEVLASLALGMVQSWKQALTLQTPFSGFDQLTIVPYLAGLVTATVATSFSLRLRRRWPWALAAPGLLLILSIAFSTYVGRLPGVVGAAWIGLALGWTLWRAALARVDPGTMSSGAPPATRSARFARIAPLAVVLVVALVGGGATATAASFPNRDVLREHVVPPLDLRDYATPLSSYRKYVRDGEDSTLFTVEGLPAGAAIRLATLDFYDGVVYKVSGSGGAGSGVFARVGREVQPAPVGDPATVTIAIQDLAGVWVPTVGYASGFEFTSADAANLGSALHYNSATGTAIVTTGLTSADTYRLTVATGPEPTEEELLQAEVDRVVTPAPAAVPDEVVALTDKVTAGATTEVEQIRAIEAYFHSEGFYSDGLEGHAVSRSGHTVDREADLLAGTQMIGDDEQYAVAMALMVAQLGIPVRVVMGFQPDDATEGTLTVTGRDVAAWVEVPFQNHGWVAFSPTPDEDRVPLEETPQQSQKPQANVAQPPRSPQEPAELPPTTPLEDISPEDDKVDLSWLWASMRIVGVSLLVLLALLGPSAALATARMMRRKRRLRNPSTVARVDGGWAELIDTATDVGAPLVAGATRREQARVIDETYPRVTVGTLAVRADAAVFGEGEPDDADVERFWRTVDEVSSSLRGAVPWHRRMLALLFPASVMRRIASFPASMARRTARRRRGGPSAEGGES